MTCPNRALQRGNTWKWLVLKVGKLMSGWRRPVAAAPPVHSIIFPSYCPVLNILSIPSLAFRLIDSGNQTVWITARCSNRGQVVSLCRLKAALMVSAKWARDTHRTVGLSAAVWADIKACRLRGRSSPRTGLRLPGRLSAGFTVPLTTCALLAGEHLYLSGVHGLKRPFSVQTHSLAAGIPSVLRKYN